MTNFLLALVTDEPSYIYSYRESDTLLQLGFSSMISPCNTLIMYYVHNYTTIFGVTLRVVDMSKSVATYTPQQDCVVVVKSHACTGIVS